MIKVGNRVSLFDNMGKEGAINNIDNMELKYAQSNVSFSLFYLSFI